MKKSTVEKIRHKILNDLYLNSYDADKIEYDYQDISLLTKHHLKIFSKKSIFKFNNEIIIHANGIKKECHLCSIRYYLDNINSNIKFYTGFALWVCPETNIPCWILHSFVIHNNMLIELSKHKFEKYVGYQMEKEQIIFLDKITKQKQIELNLYEHIYST